MNLNDLDLNLLRVFNQLMIERRVSSVADSLGVSQPAVSNALKRLRGLLGDELFLRTAQGMQPTPLADQIAEPIAYAIDSIRAAMNQQVQFEPASAQRNFVLGLIDLGEMFFLPPLLVQLCRQAPGVSITTIRSNNVSLKEDMEAGRVDVAMGLLPQLQGSFFRQRLFRQRFVLAFRKGHSLASKRSISQADFLACEHAVVVSPGTGHGEVDRLMERKGMARKIRVTVPHFNAIGNILEATDLVATVPHRLAEMLEKPFNVMHVSHPLTLAEVSIDIFWHARLHRDPANQWLRRMIFNLFSEQGPVGTGA
jgi:DNA-binding transcriptional LysR family regulator